MANKELWVAVLQRIKPTINRANFITWFQNTIILERKENEIVVGVPSFYADDWVSKKYNLKILQALQEIDPTVATVKYEIHTRLAEKGNKEGVDIKALLRATDDIKITKGNNPNEVNISRGNSREHVSSQMLNEKYRLDNFVIGRDNRLPHAACSAVCNEPGGIYNPLYIYGTTGLGKTHLLQAVGNEIIKNRPDMVVQYLTAERFVSEVIEAISKRQMNGFKARYRNVDCFLIDDVQFFVRKDSSQQEFFHTFNELYNRNKQIILTSDRPPSELQELDGRLTSRFGMGMVVELLPPDFETRVAILHEKSREFELMLDPEVINFIATNVFRSVRELEGVLRQTVADTELSQSVPTIRSVAEIIKKLNKAQVIIGYDFNPEDKKVIKSREDILSVVADYYKLTVNDLTGKDRHKEIMLPRQICMYLIKNELDESYEKIGLTFGGRNHTTVLHACNKTAKHLKKDMRLIRDVNSIKREMGL